MIQPEKINTPAYIYDLDVLRSSCERWSSVCKATRITQFYPLKANASQAVLETIANWVNGFAASSLNEAIWAKEVAPDLPISFTSPAIREDEIIRIFELCRYVTFNSISQYSKFRFLAPQHVTCGLRLNPELSFIDDPRYDPCTKGSRLGVPLSELARQISLSPETFRAEDFLHFHSNCDSNDWSQLRKTVEAVCRSLSGLIHSCSAVNLGGGYLLPTDGTPTELFHIAELVKSTFGASVVIEPGAGLVRSSCALISRVLDIVASQEQTIAILDSTVNHVPEVFEYQYTPDLRGDREDGEFEYTFGGSTCLAGDVFGNFAFNIPLQVGEIVTFENVGAYAHAKSHMFNGVALPSSYTFEKHAGFKELSRPMYEDYRAKQSGTIDENF